MDHLEAKITEAWENRDLLKETETIKAIREVVSLLDAGKLRTA